MHMWFTGHWSYKMHGLVPSVGNQTTTALTVSVHLLQSQSASKAWLPVYRRKIRNCKQRNVVNILLQYSRNLKTLL
jgi:hypothetical protein